MRIRHQRAVAAALVTPLLLLGVTACSDDEPSADPTSSDTTTETPTDTPTDEPTGGTATGEPVADPQGVFDDMISAMRDAKTVKVASDLGVGTAQGAMAYDGDETDLLLKMDMGPVSGLELRVVDGDLYMSWPNTLTEDGKFFKVEEGSKLGDLVDSLRSSSPVDSANDISESVTAMKEVGPEQIGTDDTIHYIVTIDTEKSSEFLGGTETEGVPNVDLPKSLDVDMWVTTDNLMRRVVVSLGTAAMQLDYTDWGKPVDITAPAPQDIVKAPKGF